MVVEPHLTYMFYIKLVYVYSIELCPQPIRKIRIINIELTNDSLHCRER